MSSIDELSTLSELPCPLCGLVLYRESMLGRARWRCRLGHGYSNERVLLAEVHTAAQAGAASYLLMR
jgi:hypothetical protein